MSWEYLLKAPNDSEWKLLINNIRDDSWPQNRKKYVRYTNLDKINKDMVEYYFKVGKNPNKRMSSIEGILEEMRRSSNARYDIQDS